MALPAKKKPRRGQANTCSRCGRTVEQEGKYCWTCYRSLDDMQCKQGAASSTP